MLEGNHLELCLKLINVQIQREPTNPLFQTIRTALLLEKQGKNKEALKLYLRCQNDEFCVSRIQKLSPLQLQPVSVERGNLASLSSEATQKPALTQLLTTEEHLLFNVIVSILKRNEILTRDALMKETGLSQERIPQLIERLQQKGYLSKFERRYRHIRVLRHPIVQQGMVGLPKEEVTDHFLNLTPRTLVFSLENHTLSVVNRPIVNTEASKVKPEVFRPKILTTK